MQTCLAEIDVFSPFCQIFFCQGKCYIGFIGSGAKHSLQRFPEEFRQQFTVVKLSNVADNKQRSDRNHWGRGILCLLVHLGSRLALIKNLFCQSETKSYRDI